MPLKIIYKNIKELEPYEKNARKNDDGVDAVANSIKEFGFKNPIIIDKNNVIIAGHTRYKASKKLGLEEVPCIIADDLTDEQVKALRLADNKTSEMSSWDFDLLDEELNNILDINMEDFGFDLDVEKEIKNTQEVYTSKIDIPHYEITGEKPKIFELTDFKKYKEIIKDIENSDITEEEKEFLKFAATRHIIFNYKNIAEYYAHSEKNMQELMEKSALVIIDIDNAIKNGYAYISNEIEEMSEEDYDEK